LLGQYIAFEDYVHKIMTIFRCIHAK